MTSSHLPDHPITGTVVHQGTSADSGLAGELEHLAPAAAAALRLLADAITRGGTDHGDVVQALKDSQVAEAFASVFDAAAARVWDDHERAGGDPYDFDVRLDADNLSAVAIDIRDAIRPWI
ncbi:hypothetical protein [Kitasatospora sp. NPDC059160]|uniref:hypothetical protein n=1 Tax=Kitasatospora sp. NPDC059160 TaxID=3346748 RepID=UPI0036810497